MKLRIRGNSVRLRLVRAEVAELIEYGKVEEVTDFGTGQRFEYALRISGDVLHPGATFRAGRIELTLPVELARDWANGQEVGISVNQPLGAGTGSLHLLIEKDFACLKLPPGEDQSGAFPHPEDAECKADE